MMKPNTHLEHPEDLILTGETWVLDSFYQEATISQKIDGAPAIVFGTHPQTGKFFVSTKSAFNKKKFKFCYTLQDIDRHFGHIPEVANILLVSWLYLPRVDGVYQGDFIGFGGTDTYKPNTLTYKFDEVVTEKLVFAVHTRYLTDAATPLWQTGSEPCLEAPASAPGVRWVQPIVDRLAPQGAAPSVAAGVQFLTAKEAAQAKVAINALIKSGQEVDDETLVDILDGNTQLTNLYQLVIDMKNTVLDNVIVYDAPKSYIGDERVQGEGFVYHHKCGSFKVVNRKQFSYANFTQGKFQ